MSVTINANISFSFPGRMVVFPDAREDRWQAHPLLGMGSSPACKNDLDRSGLIRRNCIALAQFQSISIPTGPTSRANSVPDK
jgi:hypothetical protein